MKYVIMSLLLIVTLCSCVIYKGATQFTADSIRLGMDKEYVMKTFGKPFKTDSYIEDGKNIDILYYKEALYKPVRGYVITTVLRFENSTLMRISQEDEYISDERVLIQSSPAR